MTALVSGALAVLTEPKTVEQMATFYKNYVDALVAKGFTRPKRCRS
jgi:hypothetical protein